MFIACFPNDCKYDRSSVCSDQYTADIDLSNDSEVKVYANATLEDDFAEDRVLVVLSNEASLKFHSFQANEFSDISCTGVEDLSGAFGSKVKAQVECLQQSGVATMSALNTVDISKN